jgi:hypothetical protein
MRFAPRLAVPVSVLTLALAGCGGATVTVQEVPGEPTQLTVPGDAAALAPEATATATPTPTPTADANTAAVTPTPDSTGTGTGTGTGDATTQAPPAGTTEGGTAAPGTDDGATNDQPPPAGSNAQKFEDFCAENPGAC